MTIEKVGIGLVGLGTVGTGIVEIIERKKNIFKKKYNIENFIKGISAKNKIKKRSFDINKFTWFQNPLKMIDDNEIKIIVELVGGSDGLALDLAKQTLKKVSSLLLLIKH